MSLQFFMMGINYEDFLSMNLNFCCTTSNVTLKNGSTSQTHVHHHNITFTVSIHFTFLFTCYYEDLTNQKQQFQQLHATTFSTWIINSSSTASKKT